MPDNGSTEITIDGNKIASEVITTLTKDFITSLGGSAASFLRKNVAIHFESFEKYLQRTYNKCNSVRVILDKDRVYQLMEIYVQAKYNIGSNEASDLDICTRARDSGRIVVQGFGGIGKTILLKYIWMSIFTSSEGKIPVFVELKKFNDISKLHLQTYLRATLSDGDANFTDEEFELLCDTGRFVFLFDAFDEINDERREEVEQSILALSNRFPKVGVVVSSRRDHRFYSWEQFSSYYAKPFNREQIKKVIKAVDFDKDVKKQFNEKILDNDDKFKKFSDFLSTPLLSLMMLLMYRQFADVPEKIHIFYRYAFQTLYSLHDGAKEQFRRQRKTTLNEDQFAKIFSIFSLMSYIQTDNTFQSSAIKSLTNAAKTRAGIDVPAEKFIEEATESVNLLYKEGDVYSYVHRSFQEYFSAFALVNFFSTRLVEIFDKLPDRQNDSVLMMAYEMNSDIVEDNYILPQYRANKDFLDKIIERGTDTSGVLEAVGAKWVFLMSKTSKAHNLLQESLYLRTGPIRFINTVGQCVYMEYYRDFIEKEIKGRGDAATKALSKFIMDLIPPLRVKESRPVVVIIDFEKGFGTYDGIDGTSIRFTDAEFSLIRSRAYGCHRFVLSRLELWQRAIRFVQSKMPRIIESEAKRIQAMSRYSVL
jgi:hypothetical protein